MSTEDIKTTTFSFLTGILKTPYAIPGGGLYLLWKWIQLTPEEVARVKELEFLFNSAIGVAVAILMVIAGLSIAGSYFFTLLRTAKEDFREMFTEPLIEMTAAIRHIQTKVEVITEIANEEFTRSADHKDRIEQKLYSLSQFFEGK